MSRQTSYHYRYHTRDARTRCVCCTSKQTSARPTVRRTGLNFGDIDRLDMVLPSGLDLSIDSPPLPTAHVPTAAVNPPARKQGR